MRSEATSIRTFYLTHRFAPRYDNASRYARRREERQKLRRENEHLKKEIKRAADKIVQLTREKEEGNVENVKFVG